jgi:nickel-type superoxide dismutase maturation protease
MSPLLQPGDEVLVDLGAYRRSAPSPGDIVVAWHPYQVGQKIIKRVQSVTHDGDCFLIGDNPNESSDSRSLGSLSPKQIIGRVTSRFE